MLDKVWIGYAEPWAELVSVLFPHPMRSRNKFGMTKWKRRIQKQFWDDKMGKVNPETRLG